MVILKNKADNKRREIETSIIEWGVIECAAVLYRKKEKRNNYVTEMRYRTKLIVQIYEVHALTQLGDCEETE